MGEKYESTSEDKVIAVMGPTGVGKSSFVRVATGDESVHVGHTLQSATQSISAHRVLVDNRQVVLLDTPGFDDTHTSDVEVLKHIANWLATSYVGGHRLTAVIYLHRISDSRMAGSAIRNLVLFRKLIGDDALRNVVLVTTMWDRIDQVNGAERERTLVDTPEFWGEMVSRGSTVARFDRTREGASSIIRSLLNRTTRTLNIQKEMIDNHLQLEETEAGKEVLANITKLKLQHEREIRALRSDMEEALSQNDKAAAEALAELSKELASAQAQIDALQSRNPEIEALQIRHEQEMKSLKDSLEDRMRFLEEQASSPPPAYAEAGMTIEEDVRDTAQSATSPNIYASQSIIFLIWTLFLYFGRLIRRLWRPRVRAGYRRIEWTCTCGELLYGDFKEGSPGSLDKLAARLRKHPGTGPGQSSSNPSSGSPPNMTTPPKLHLRRSDHPMNWSLPGNEGQVDLDPENQASGRRAPDPLTPVRREALQLCIETGRYSLELEELELYMPESDGILFQRIRKRYEHSRHSALPMKIRFSKPDRVIFVKFRLGKRPFVSPIAGSINAPSIPPEEEVIAGNYNYDPCPIDEPPIDNRTFFHHFYSPASLHPEMIWGPRLPRKLGPSPTPMAQAWGIHLEERPDWPLFAAMNFISLLASGAIAGIYSWKTNDTPTGVAIGAWLTAVQTMGVTTLFFWWT